MKTKSKTMIDTTETMKIKCLPLAATAGLAQGSDGSRTCAMSGPALGRKPVLALLMPLLWAAALLLPAFGAQAGVVFTNLHSFQVFTNGAYPKAVLVQGSDGSFYGTTSGGGTNGGNGTLFKISATGTLTTLYSFAGGNNGVVPSGLVQGGDGNLYGTTQQGGTNNNGTVFQISTNGAYTGLHSFTGGLDGATPWAGLVQGSDGDFYGTTYSGGAYTNQYGGGQGTVFKISANGMLATLYSFTGTNDGGNPQAGLVQGADGNLYGTTYSGGAYTNQYGESQGTVFRISTNGTLTTLYSFTGHSDGGNPNVGLVQGADGNFYGTTELGGPNYAGTVFKIGTNGVLRTVYIFGAGNDGDEPNGLVPGLDGNLYGTCAAAGAGSAGTVFKITTNGALATLYAFSGGVDGKNPWAGLAMGADGKLYGTTEYGGTSTLGTVFKISTSGTLARLYSFTGSSDGAQPLAGLAQGSDGDLYGVTSVGGAKNSNGTVFKISTNGALTSLYSFTGGNDGGRPQAPLVRGTDGNFYGTTFSGGTDGYGTVFKFGTNGALTHLYSFTGSNDGANPFSWLIQGSDGDFYGTTLDGGAYTNQYGGLGTVFRITADGVLTSLYSFNGTNDGANPWAGLAQGGDGNFYGTTQVGGAYTNQYGQGNGTVFKISTNGHLTSLYSFTGTNDGAGPDSWLVQGGDGNFYGTTWGGGAYTNQNGGLGTVFRITADGVLTTLHSFNGTNDGQNPQAGLMQASDGNFYGVTTGGSPAGSGGTVFKISANGTLTTLYSFSGGNDGAAPVGGLVQGSDGSFYGTTYTGGQGGAGTVFRLTVVGPPAPVFQAATLANRTLSLTWSTEPGGLYQLQYNSDLSSTNWTNLGSPAAATGATLSTTASVTNGPPRFYRAVLLP
jgi:uncharacterized repeat protein (TIGR03803 family)